MNQSTMTYELKYMQRCLQLARYGGGYVAPNPMVGAVVVCNDRIIGEGYHHHFGEAHAEINAIHSVVNSELLEKSVLYVNLEPCAHFGKTPPCADFIVESGIPRVVIGMLDPNPKVSGRGVEILQNAGIQVIVGIMEKECRDLNKRFFIFQEQQRPYILLKWAQTQDGFIDRIRTDNSEPPLQISNPVTKQLTHKMRSENQAILVGVNTVLLDNPSLTVREWTGKSPDRIAIDRQGRIPADYTIMDGSVKTIIFTEKEHENRHNLEFIKIKFDENVLQNILKSLFEQNIHSVMVEGGAGILNIFIESGKWDEANVEVSPLKIGEGVKAPVLRMLPVSKTSFNGHEWLYFENKKFNR
jgi:diaminohydroxyphosphoribosylaminopyrimidine deaminase/5-amino-6-(5-phosphoribosylamino)uracil reductase